jgi:hypothetical protein
MNGPLPITTIQTLARFRPVTDLEAMRVHTESFWGRIPPLLGADATTFGSHVLIRPASYRPDTSWGLALLAHESGHIPQWRQFGVLGFLVRYGAGLVSSRFVHDAHPLEAELVAEQRRIRAELAAEMGDG